MTAQERLHVPAEATMPQAIPDRIKLPHAPRELSVLVGRPKAVTYRRLYTAVLNGDVPAAMDKGRWTLHRGDLPAIAVTLGLATVPEPAPAQAA